MSFLSHLAAMRHHGEWADQRLLDVLRSVDAPAALRECAHVRGAQETWLSRIQQRAPTLPVWPEVSVSQLADIGETVDAAWRTFLEDVDDAQLDIPVSYRTVAGDPFTTPLSDILTHLMLHGQYHRGKANAALRAAGAAASIDYILWQRTLSGR